MIPQELIDRLKKCCEWLEKEMPEKFYWNTKTITLFLKNTPKGKRMMINLHYTNPVEQDPLCEYPNALHRIVKEACNKELYQTLQRYPCSQNLYDEVVPMRWFYKLHLINYQFPLHAEIEATCIAIEGLMKGE